VQAGLQQRRFKATPPALSRLLYVTLFPFPFNRLRIADASSDPKHIYLQPSHAPHRGGGGGLTNEAVQGKGLCENEDEDHSDEELGLLSIGPVDETYPLSASAMTMRQKSSIYIVCQNPTSVALYCTRAA